MNPEGRKVAHVATISSLIEACTIYLPHLLWAPWVNDFIEECIAFPNAAHDDMVDAMTPGTASLAHGDSGGRSDLFGAVPDQPI